MNFEEMRRALRFIFKFTKETALNTEWQLTAQQRTNWTKQKHFTKPTILR